MADPYRLYDNLPPCYDEDSGRGTYHLLSGLAVALGNGETALNEFIANLTVSTATGEGLVRLGENYVVPNPSILTEVQFAVLIRTKAPCKRGTIQAIRSVFEAATGLTGITVEDRYIDAAIPHYEIWIYVPSESYGFGSYAEPYVAPAAVKPNYVPPWPPEDSCYLGTMPDYTTSPVTAGDLVYDGYGQAGGEYNDHWWGAIDLVTESIVDSVKLAGTIIVYKYA